MEGKKIEWDNYSLLLDKERIILLSGDFYYWRVSDKNQWEKILKTYKASGFNCVRIPFHWGYHSIKEGSYNFKDSKDINYLLELCEKLNLFVICAVGPYTRLNTNAGGFPVWLLQKRDIFIRNLKKSGSSKFDQNYLNYCLQWFENLIPIIKSHQISENPNGSIIIVQFESHYGKKGIPEYMNALKSNLLNLGISVPLVHNDEGINNNWKDITDLYAFDLNIEWATKNPKNLPYSEEYEVNTLSKMVDGIEKKIMNLDPPSNEKPIFISEIPGGEANHWSVPYTYDELYSFYGSYICKVLLQSIVAQRATIMNLSPVFGGSNYGTIGNPIVYSSNDLGTGIREYGYISDKLKHTKLFNIFVDSFMESLSKTEIVTSPNIKCRINNLFSKQRLSLEDGTDYYFFRNFNEKGIEDFSISLLDARKEDGTRIEGTIIPKIGKQKIKFKDGFIAIGNHALDGFKIKFCSLPIILKTKYAEGTLLVFVQNRGELLLEETGFKTKGYINSIEEENFTRFSFVNEGYDTIISKEGKKLYVIFLKEENALNLNVFRSKANINDCKIIWGSYSSSIDEDDNLELNIMGSQDLKLISQSTPKSGFNNLKEIHIPGIKFGIFDNDYDAREIKLEQWQELITDWGNSKDVKLWKEINFETEREPLYHGFLSGCVLYKCIFNPGTNQELKIGEENPVSIKFSYNARHKAGLWLNGKFIHKLINYSIESGKAGSMRFKDSINQGKTEIDITKDIIPETDNILYILTESLGQNEQNFPWNNCQNPRGLLNAKFSKKNIETNWFISGIDVISQDSSYESSGLPGEIFNFHNGEGENWIDSNEKIIKPDEQLKWFKSKFKLDINKEINFPLRIHLSGKYSAFLFVNKRFIGRYWGDYGPQCDFYINDSLLKAENLISIAVWTDEEEKLSISILPYNIENESGNISENGKIFSTKKFKITF